MQYVTLNNGVKMPMMGLGTFQVIDPSICERAVIDAINCGYRLIDTAAAYYNEEAVGKAIEESGIDRKDLFLSTKLWIQDATYEGAKQAFNASLEKLKTDYLDLYLIHHPLNDYYGAWRAMEDLYKEGKIRAIGVCNFSQTRLLDFMAHVNVAPAINQIEAHPFAQRAYSKHFLDEVGIQMMAWAPFAEGSNNIFSNPVLCNIGKKHGKVAAQVVLRWLIQRNIVVIPKTIHKEHMQTNMDIWDFELSYEDISQIKELNKRSYIADFNDPALVKSLLKIKVHG